MGNNDDDYREVVEDFVAGKFKGAENLITRRLPVQVSFLGYNTTRDSCLFNPIVLQDLVEKGLEELVHNRDEHVKIVATWKNDMLN